EQLLQTEAGWSVPLALLRAWARGMRGDPAARLGFGPQQPGQAALPSLLEEDGWSVQYRDWFTAQDPPMPRRVFARSGERQVRLVVERWLTPEQAMLPAGIRSPDSGR